MSQYTCCKCNGTFDKPSNENWNEFKAAEELLTLYPETKNDPTDILCDDCNKLFVKWFSQFTDEEKKQMRDDYYKKIGELEY